jgi:hypothetical protein
LDIFFAFFVFLVLLLSRIRPSGLFPFIMNVELLILQRVCRTPWTGDQPVAKPLQYKHSKCRHISTPRVQFDPTIPVLERQKTFRALDRTATMIYKLRINLWILVQGTDLSQCLRMQIQHKHGKLRTYPCLYWDSSPQPQYSSDQRQDLPQTARPLFSAAE